MANVLVVGSGAIGGLLAALLAEKGHTVEARGRGRTVARMRVEGGGYGPDRAVALGALPAGATPDLVLVAVKTQDLEGALREHADAMGGAPVVALQNGLAQDDLVAAAVGPARAVAAVVALDAEYLGGDTVRCARKGTLLIGAPDPVGAAPAMRAREILRDAVSVDEAGNVRGARWTKLLVNLQNVVPALTGLSYQEVAKHPDLARAVVRMVREAREVSDAEGVTLAPLPWTNPMLLRALSRLPEAVALPLYAKRVEKVLGKTPAYGSTWQSMQRGQSLETEWLNGEVVRRGQARGIATPVNARATDLAAKGARMSADECARALLGGALGR